ncbi:hypothetical protein [Acuticoccus mangrovi]|nr:hypothetical protein [Acuticoccus mangrovi]
MAEVAGDLTESKSAFAARINVSPSRVSQYIAEGKLGPGCLDGDGRGAKVKVAAALAALKVTLDISQRLGNGAATRLSAAALPAGAMPLATPDVSDEIQREKLREIQMRNEDRERDRAIAAGQYVHASHHRAAVTDVVRVVLNAFDSELPSLGTRIAASLEVDGRRVRHELAGGMRSVREAVAARLAQMADREPSLVDDPETTRDDEADA